MNVNVINENIFSVNIDGTNGKEGNKGMIFSNLKLDYNSYEVVQMEKNTIKNFERKRE